MKRFPLSCALVAVLLLGVLVMLSPAPLALAATPATLVTTPASHVSHQDSGSGPIFTCLGGRYMVQSAFSSPPALLPRPDTDTANHLDWDRQYNECQ